jgi:hypothetical protein
VLSPHSAVGQVQAPLSGSQSTVQPSPETPEQRWVIRSGSTIVSFNEDALAARGVGLHSPAETDVPLPDAWARRLIVKRNSTLTFGFTDGSITSLGDGGIRHLGDLVLTWPGGELRLDDITIRPVGEDPALWLAQPRTGEGGLILKRVKAGFDLPAKTFTLQSAELRFSPQLAEALGDPGLAEIPVGAVAISANARWIGGAEPVIERGWEPRTPVLAGGADMTFCQLYGLYMPSGSRDGDVVGLSVATTSWNIGDADLMWFNIPDEEHPFIVMNLYRLKDDRFEQIGQSHIKHGFYALGSHQCGGPPCTYEPGHGAGDWLGQNCTDTYSASLNAVQSGMGPRYEVNPWTGGWYYPGSHMDGGHGHGAVTHRIQVHDADLDPAQNAGATYYAEGYYVILDDIDVMNSAAWKPVTVSGSPGGTWTFGMSGSGTYPEIGFAIDAWPGATQTLLAQEIPVEEFVSPDGRCVLAAKATDLGNGMWHYEYALLNIDMDLQVGAFIVPVSANMVVTNAAFSAVEHHDEPFNCADPDQVAIDNAPWVMDIGSTAIRWTTTTNPLRWGTLYNFRFDADAPPAEVTATLGMFREGPVTEVTGRTVGPEAVCPADLDGDGNVGTSDLLELLSAWGPNPGHPADLDGNGTVGTADLLELLSSWGPC